MTAGARPAAIRTAPQPRCPSCGADGRLLYRGLRDRFLATPGEWDIRECPAKGCGALWLDPMPLEEDIGRAYESYHMPETKPPSGLRKMRTRFIDAFVRHRMGYAPGRAPVRSAALALGAALYPGGGAELARSVVYLEGPAAGRRFLEVGCGRGELLATLQDLGWRVEGVDFDPAAIEIARSRGVAARVGTVFAYEGGNDTIDAISLVHVVEHLHDPARVLRRCFEILKPGGLLVVVTPNAASLGRYLAGRRWVHLDPPRHVILYRRKGLERLAEAAGFSVERAVSSAYGARSVPALAWTIWRTGRGGVFGRRLALSAHLLGMPLQLLERAATAVGLDAGEELVLIARKPEPAVRE